MRKLRRTRHDSHNRETLQRLQKRTGTEKEKPIGDMNTTKIILDNQIYILPKSSSSVWRRFIMA